ALLENLRFHKGEEANDPGFAKALAALGDAYVDDAFSAAHRAHASIEALAHLLPAAAGKNMQAELEALGAALENPQRPVIALIGGAKVSTKLDLLNNLTDKVERLAIGGAMANTFRARHGRAGEKGRRIDRRRQVDERRGRRRHRGGARDGRGHEPAQLCLDRRRRLSRMARRPRAPGGQGAGERLSAFRSLRQI